MSKEWQERTVRRDEIEIDLSLQMRVMEPPHEEYVEILQRNKKVWPFPPLRAIQVGDRLLCVEGFTRHRAATEANRVNIPIEIKEGTWEDAVAEACGSNADHGFRRTAADKRRAIIRYYEEVTQSATKIAKICRVARSTVYTVIDEINGGHQDETVASATTANGRAESASPDPVRKPSGESEIDDECPVCGNVNWEATDSGYVCATCQYDHNEVAAVEEEEREDRASRRELIEGGVAADLAEARSAYGRLQRALSKAGLAETTERPLLTIHKKIEDAIRTQNLRK